VLTRRRLLTGTLAVLAAPLAVEAQQVGTVRRIGYLAIGSDAFDPQLMEPLRQGLRDSGWVEGQNLVVEYRSAEGKAEQLAELAADLVRLNVDVIVALVPGAVVAARSATQTIPIVMVHGPDPVQLGLVGSLAHPGGNITGLTTLSAELSAKQLDLLKALVPRASRVAVLSNPINPWHAFALEGIEATAKLLRVHLQVLRVRGGDELDAGFAAMVKQRADAVLVLADPMTVFYRARIVELAAKHHLPAMGSVRQFAEAGTLASYWPNAAEMGRRAASYVHRILRGARPGDLPIEQPTKYEFVINLKTAKALGLTIPPSLLARADQVIE
jgi:putative ABC transport system substrate-binding protein